MKRKAVTGSSPEVAQDGKRPRGRPRAYDREIALTRAMDVFWEAGYAATSLDDLSDAMGMNRPSIYAAFGDKEALYREALNHYRTKSRVAMGEALAADRPLRRALEDFYERAIELYSSGETSARGCFTIGTALTEAVTNPELRLILADGLRGLDRALSARISLGQERGEVGPDANPAELGQVASAMLYLLAIQARTGATRHSLRRTMKAALNAICTPSDAQLGGRAPASESPSS
jgi:AcrR family transcriptional regulator